MASSRLSVNSFIHVSQLIIRHAASRNVVIFLLIVFRFLTVLFLLNVFKHAIMLQHTPNPRGMFQALSGHISEIV